MKSRVSHGNRIDAGSPSFHRSTESGILGGLSKPCGGGVPTARRMISCALFCPRSGGKMTREPINPPLGECGR